MLSALLGSQCRDHLFRCHSREADDFCLIPFASVFEDVTDHPEVNMASDCVPAFLAMMSATLQPAGQSR